MLWRPFQPPSDCATQPGQSFSSRTAPDALHATCTHASSSQYTNTSLLTCGICVSGCHANQPDKPSLQLGATRSWMDHNVWPEVPSSPAFIAVFDRSYVKQCNSARCSTMLCKLFWLHTCVMPHVSGHFQTYLILSLIEFMTAAYLEHSF